MHRVYDVAVVGGGPAGTAAGLALARRGAQVALLERTAYAAARIGETLPPALVRPLSELGVVGAFLGDCHSPNPGLVVAWGREHPYDNDYLFNPYGHGWRVDRTRFDAMLVSEAEAAGVAVFRQTRVAACNRTRSRVWNLHTRGGVDGLAARWVIDATGRAATLARRLGAEVRRLDRLVALVVFGASAPSVDPRTVIEAAQDGWWYAASLPEGRCVAAFLTDVDLMPCGDAARAEFWAQHLLRTTLIASRLLPADPVHRPISVAAHSAKLARSAGEAWVAVGDADFSRDPLSGQGVYAALTSGIAAAAAISAQASGDLTAIDRYVNEAEREFQAYCSHRRRQYSLEDRWPTSPFWSRRRTIATAGE